MFSEFVYHAKQNRSALRGSIFVYIFFFYKNTYNLGDGMTRIRSNFAINTRLVEN